MFGLETLDIMIGLATIYLVFGMACTAIVEAIMVAFNVRSKNLEQALSEFLAGDVSEQKKFIDEFYANPLVQSLSQGKDGRPSYIPANIVSQVVQGIVTANGAVPKIDDGINALPDSRIKVILSTFSREVQGDVNAFRKAIETHFDCTMDRASGWVKRRSHNFTLLVSVILVLGANLDTVSLTNSLAANPEARLKLVEVAQQKVNETQLNAAAGQEAGVASAKSALAEATSNLSSAGVQLGWKGYRWEDSSIGDILTKLAGLLVSIFAVSLGAPFWFDVLQKFMQVRAAGASPREVEKKKKTS